ncbi:MAG: thiamine pyrophosphate-dependent enzyme, partial [Betaproteobacteria bacterium]|nr:thiamine pyrophosphate-dependent enzyme [Betaproteobacteria bacterium]
YYVDLHTPDFAQLARSIGLPHSRMQDLSALDGVLRDALAQPGPALIEVDMTAIGPFARAFSGPPVRKVQA